jgi:CBS domain-containing protein
MTDADRLPQIAQQLREGKPPPSLTVREFLSWFGAQRRGYWIVKNIREALEQAGLQTEPDFESAYIDAPVTLMLAPQRPAETAAATQGELSGTAAISFSAAATLTAPPSYADPTYRISKLPAANNPPMSVTPDAPINVAVTLMLTHDYSQLPVMTNERDVKGVISWASIATRTCLGKGGTITRELMDVPHQEIRADASLFQAIPLVVQHQYVLVRGADNRISGIITGSDLSLQFQQLAEPFLLLGEIENHIRRLIGDQFTREELSSARDPGDTDRVVNVVADMTFGEYIRLLENPDRWAKLELSIDRTTFCKYLDGVRTIRNDVMHFDPDGIPPGDLDRLRDFTRFLQRLQGIGVP